MRSVDATSTSLDCAAVSEKTLKLTLEYDGTGFRGWARQPGERTVEGVLRDALDTVYGRWSHLAVAGRTDTGVHASAQVASVLVDGGPPPERVADALNAALPADIAVLGVEPPRSVPRDTETALAARLRELHWTSLLDDLRDRSIATAGWSGEGHLGVAVEQLVSQHRRMVTAR